MSATFVYVRTVCEYEYRFFPSVKATAATNEKGTAGREFSATAGVHFFVFILFSSSLLACCRQCLLRTRLTLTMAYQPPPFVLPPVPTGALVASLNENDVLLGRGVGPSQYIGNKRFRRLVESRKAEYVALDSYNDKAIVAWEVYNEIHARGGRFLKLVQSGKQARSVVTKGVWRQASEEAALEKCKQALREKQAPLNEANEQGGAQEGRHEKEAHESGDGNSYVVETEPRVTSNAASLLGLHDASAGTASATRSDSSVVATASTSMAGSSNVQPFATASVASLSTPNTLQSALFGNTVPSAIDPHLLLFCHPLLRAQQQQQQLAAQQEIIKQEQQRKQEQQEMLAQQQMTAQYQLLRQHQQMVSHPLFPIHLNHNHLVHSSNMICVPGAANTLSFDHSMSLAIEQGLHERNLARNILQYRARAILLAQAESAARLGGVQQSSMARNDRLQDMANFDLPTETGSCLAPESLLGTMEHLPASETDLEDAAFALSAMAVAANRPVFTEEEEEIERASMSDEEKAAALCDLFGICSHSNSDAHENKRARKDLDRSSINFLIQYMRHEIEQTPADKKQALSEAQVKCRPEEFDDERLERFLRCEGMNAKASVYGSLLAN